MGRNRKKSFKNAVVIADDGENGMANLIPPSQN